MLKSVSTSNEVNVFWIQEGKKKTTKEEKKAFMEDILILINYH